MHPDLPILRDPDGWTYFKEEVGGLVVGGFEPEAKPWVSPDEMPVPVRVPAARGGLGALLGADGQRACTGSRRSRETGIRKFYNGPESFTPDNQFLLGEAPGAARLLRRRRLQLGRHRLGRRRRAGRWPSGSSTGEPTSDLVGGRHPPVRAVPRQQPRGCATGSPRCSACTTPCRGRTASSTTGPAVPLLAPARPARRRRRAASAAEMGWERPNFFAPAGRGPGIEYAWGKPNWLPWSAAEQRATRTGGRGVRPDVVLASTSSPAPTRSAALQWVCAADVDVPVGPRRLHRRCSTRAAPTRPTSPSPGSRPTSSCWSAAPRPPCATRTGCAGTCPPGAHAVVVDVTVGVRRARRDGPAVARPAGAAHRRRPGPTRRSRSRPAARSTSGTATRARHPDDLRRRARLGALRAGRARRRRVRGPARAPAPTSACADAGYYAIESLRLEKGYRAFGRELTPGLQPGRGRAAVRLQAAATDVDFLGREARRAGQRPTGRAGGWSSFVVDDPDADAVGRRAACCATARRSARSPAPPGARPSAPASGWPTSADPTPARSTPDWVRPGDYEVDVGGDRSPGAGDAAPAVRPRQRAGALIPADGGGTTSGAAGYRDAWTNPS